MTASSTGLIFGVYPFGLAGMADGVATGVPDDIQRLPEIIERLRGGRDFLLRTYVPHSGPASVAGIFALLDFCAISKMPWDVALCYRNQNGDVKCWIDVIREIVNRHGKTLNTLQITNEPNLTHVPEAGDGSQPNVRRRWFRA